MKYYALAYYIFTPIDDPTLEVMRHKQFFKDRNVTGRIYIAKEGINGQMSGAHEDALAYMKWLKSDLRFSEVVFKVHESDENVFPRMTVKTREQLVALDKEVDTKAGGEHISPQKWREMLESEDESIYLLDVRNDYESEIGHFEGADLPPLKTFRDFLPFAKRLNERVDPKKCKVMMYCTGGIRCELYSALLKKQGFENVYQLDGGVIAYGQQEGNKHWKGKLFVFDERMAIPIDDQEAEPIATCTFCKTPCDTHYNCANMDCNDLFLACSSCIEKNKGVCCDKCFSAPRLRPFEARLGNKPFCRKHLIPFIKNKDTN